MNHIKNIRIMEIKLNKIQLMEKCTLLIFKYKQNEIL